MKKLCDITIRVFRTVELEIPEDIDFMNKKERAELFNKQLDLNDDSELAYVEVVDDENVLLDL